MSVILDASALLAWLHDEPGSKMVDEVLHQAIISTVNWSEVIQKSISKGVDIEGMRGDIEALGVRLKPLDVNVAELAAHIWLENKKGSLSLADRICLALAQTSNLPVLTADKDWIKAAINVQIQLIR